MNKILLLLLLFPCFLQGQDYIEWVGDIPAVDLIAINHGSMYCKMYYSGEVTTEGDYSVTERGIVFATHANPTISDSKHSNGLGLGFFLGAESYLHYNTTYYVRAYVIYAGGSVYSEQEYLFTTNDRPDASITSISAITGSSATVNVAVSTNGNYITGSRVVYGTSSLFNVNQTIISTPAEQGDYSVTLTGLAPNTTYFVAARLDVGCSTGLNYSVNTTFTTATAIEEPTVSTTAASNIGNTSATTGGSVTNNGGGTVSARGICYSTSSNPTLSDNTTSNGTGTGSFTSNLTGLTENTTYYVRAYATNEAGTAYGGQISFITEDINLPSVTTASTTVVGETAAVIGGNVTDDGGATINSRGCYVSTTNPPTAADDVYTASGTTGVFQINITGLTANTTYYYCAFATNTEGTKTGNVLNYTTDEELLPADYPTYTLTTGVLKNADCSSRSSYWYFTGSYADASEAARRIVECSNVGTSGIMYKIKTLSVGEQLYLYANTQPSSTTAYFLDGNVRIIYVNNGVIQSITNY